MKVGWHYQLKEHECEQTPGDSEGQGSLRCSMGSQRDTTECLNSNNKTTDSILDFKYFIF